MKFGTLRFQDPLISNFKFWNVRFNVKEQKCKNQTDLNESMYKEISCFTGYEFAVGLLNFKIQNG